jgi:hypothetical protein
MPRPQLQPGLRPSFEVACSIPREHLTREAALRLQEPHCPFDGSVLPDHLWVSLPKARRKLWSPVLEMRLLEEEGRLRVKGQFGPDPGAWTFFLALYAFTLLMAGLGLLYGSSQWMLDQAPTAFWALPGAALVLILLHGAARKGQRATGHQMQELCQCVGDLLEELESRGGVDGKDAAHSPRNTP